VRSEYSEGTSTSAWPKPSRTGSSASSSPPPGAPQAARPRPAAPAPRPVRSERRENGGTDSCDMVWSPCERGGRRSADGTGGEHDDDALLGLEEDDHHGSCGDHRADMQRAPIDDAV